MEGPTVQCLQERDVLGYSDLIRYRPPEGHVLKKRCPTAQFVPALPTPARSWSYTTETLA